MPIKRDSIGQIVDCTIIMTVISCIRLAQLSSFIVRSGLGLVQLWKLKRITTQNAICNHKTKGNSQLLG